MGKPHNGPSGHAPGDFDIYLLAQSWSPHFCCKNADRCNTVPWAFSARHLSLHGLWPGFSTPRDGGQTFPQNCEAAKKLFPNLLPREYIDVAPSFVVWDPSEHKAKVGDLGKHEWKKHGTCTGLGPDAYFGEALRAFSSLPGDRGTPTIMSNAVGGQVATQALRAAYSKRVALSADKQCRLTEVTSCWQKLPDGRVGAQVECPEHVMRGRDRADNCSALKITQLGQCLANDAQKRKR